MNLSTYVFYHMYTTYLVLSYVVGHPHSDMQVTCISTSKYTSRVTLCVTVYGSHRARDTRYLGFSGTGFRTATCSCTYSLLIIPRAEMFGKVRKEFFDAYLLLIPESRYLLGGRHLQLWMTNHIILQIQSKIL
jgi:hypothetical protein